MGVHSGNSGRLRHRSGRSRRGRDKRSYDGSYDEDDPDIENQSFRSAISSLSNSSDDEGNYATSLRSISQRLLRSKSLRSSRNLDDDHRRRHQQYDDDDDAVNISKSNRIMYGCTRSEKYCPYVHVDDDECPNTRTLREISKRICLNNSKRKQKKYCPKYSKQVFQRILKEMKKHKSQQQRRGGNILGYFRYRFKDDDDNNRNSSRSKCGGTKDGTIREVYEVDTTTSS